jgi:murein DD-endopeptidase MepM/ murein hydrolase activator NlpD
MDPEARGLHATAAHLAEASRLMAIIVFPVVGPTIICGAWGDVRPGGHVHKGVDICCPTGTPLLAVDNGTIHFGTDVLGGNVAILRADDGNSYYLAHLQSFNGSNGRRVEPGDVVGFADNTGNATLAPTHAHFEWWPNGQPSSTKDPTALLSTAQRFTSPPGAAPGPMSTREAVGVAIGIVVAAGVLAFALSPDSKPARRTRTRHA